MNAAESAIRELKRGVSRKMIWTRSPKVLWDHCIELEALIHSHSVNTIYTTNGQVPETIMTGTTADISHISEFGWYDWVMFRDNTLAFPEDNIVLRRYLGPATDVRKWAVCLPQYFMTPDKRRDRQPRTHRHVAVF
jgi:hypothetical protein